MRNESTSLGIFILILIAIFGVSLFWLVFQWNECRNMGFSFLYCLQHIS